MSMHKTSVKCRLSYILLIVIAVIGLLFGIFCSQLSGHINEISEYEGKKSAQDLINKAVTEQLEKNKNQQFVSVQRDNSGNIISVETNSEEINRVSNEITSVINDSLKETEDKEIKVPIGTLSGITYFTGKGFDVDLRIHQTGAVKSKMKSEFVSCGINQTKYRLYLETTVEISAILPTKSTDITIEDTFLVNETVIVGKIPSVYLADK